MIACGRGLAAAKGVREVADVTYLVVGPKGEEPRGIFKELLFVLVRPTKRSRVGDLAKVLVQRLGENVQVLLFESFSQFENEFGWWGSGL